MSEYDSYDYEVERENRIREEERKRRESEKIRRQLRLKERQVKQNGKKIEKLHKHLDGLMSGKIAEFLKKAQIDKIRKKLIDCKRQNNSSEDMSALLQFDGTLKKLSSSCDKMERQARRRLAEHRFKLEQERKKRDALIGLEASGNLADSLEQEEQSGFIRGELADIRLLITECNRFIKKRKFDNALKLIRQIETSCKAAARILDNKKDLFEQFRIVAEGLAELEKDPIYKTWVGSRIASLQIEISQFQIQIEQDRNLQSVEYETKLAHIEKDVDNLVKTADKKQEDELIRKDVASALIEAMREEGFAVSGPMLEGDQESDVVLTGRKPGRLQEQKVSLKVGLLGRISMDVDAGDPGDLVRIREARVDKSKEKDVACRQIASQLKAVLAKKGVKLDRKKVQWHNPDRIAKGAKELPKGSPAQRKQ